MLRDIVKLCYQNQPEAELFWFCNHDLIKRPKQVPHAQAAVCWQTDTRACKFKNGPVNQVHLVHTSASSSFIESITYDIRYENIHD